MNEYYCIPFEHVQHALRDEETAEHVDKRYKRRCARQPLLKYDKLISIAIVSSSCNESKQC